MPRRYGGGYNDISDWTNIGEDLGNLIAMLLWGKDYRAAEKAKTELTPIVQKEELTGETEPGLEYLRNLPPDMRERVRKLYVAQTGEQMPRPEIPFPTGLTGPPTPTTTAPAIQPSWPANAADYKMRLAAEQGRGTPTGKLPAPAQRMVEEQELSRFAAPYEAARVIESLEGLPPEAKQEALSKLGIKYKQPPREEFPWANAAFEAYHRYADLTQEEYENWRRYGIVPARALKERFPTKDRATNPDLGIRIDRYYDLYSYGVETGAISMADYERGLQALIDSDGKTWPKFKPVLRPVSTPFDNQAREIARDLITAGSTEYPTDQQTLSKILAMGSLEDKAALAEAWSNAKNINQTRKDAKYYASMALKLGKKKEAKEWMYTLIRSYGLTPKEQESWISRVFGALWDLVAGKSPDEQMTPEQIQAEIEKELLPYRTVRPTSTTPVPGTQQQAPPGKPRGDIRLDETGVPTTTPGVPPAQTALAPKTESGLKGNWNRFYTTPWKK